MRTFQGNWVWITGASSGIGEQLAYGFARRGCRLILSARSADHLRRVADGCTGAPEAIALPLDLANSGSMDAAMNQLASRGIVPDVLVHAGGISQRGRALETQMPVDRHIMEVNYFGPVYLTKKMLPAMLRRPAPAILVISSLAGKWGFFLRSAYAASKHALHGFFETLRLEHESDKLQVTLVTPGLIATRISVHALNAEGKPTGQMDPYQLKGMAPEACAEAIIEGFARKKREFGVGGKELKGLVIRRLFPGLFHLLIRRQAPR